MKYESIFSVQNLIKKPQSRFLKRISKFGYCDPNAQDVMRLEKSVTTQATR